MTPKINNNSGRHNSTRKNNSNLQSSTSRRTVHYTRNSQNRGRSVKSGNYATKPRARVSRPTHNEASLEIYLSKLFKFFKIAIAFLGKMLLRLLKSIKHLFMLLASKSKIAAIVILVLCSWLIVYGILTISASGKIYDRVRVGDVDVSGLSLTEASEAIQNRYQESIDQGVLYIFANEDLAANADIETQLMQQQALDEQISFEEALQNKQLWVADASSTGAYLDANDLASKAYSIGRSDGFFGDLITRTFGKNIDPSLSFDENIEDEFLSVIDGVVGTGVTASSVSMQNGVASAVSGSDGYIVDRELFLEAMNDTFLGNDSNNNKWVAQSVYATMPVSFEAATNAANIINLALNNGAVLETSQGEISIDSQTISTWINTTVEYVPNQPKTQDSAYILPYIASSAATATIVSLVNSDTSSASIAFSKDGDNIYVTSSGEISIPSPDGAIESLNNAMFGNYEELASVGGDVANARIDVDAMKHLSLEVEQFSGSMDLQTAMQLGIVSEIASYTTQFSDTASTANRTHNINLISQILNNYIVNSGDQWSFNDQAGACDESQGFKAAGAISGGEYVDDIGGGVCQVATTIFNAVYNAGLEVIERHNHSLYIASYPAGQDAAIAYPYLDLVWQNDTGSGILVQMTTGSGWVKCSLIGVNPNRIVQTETGQWEEGEEYSLRIDTDDTLDPNYYYVKTIGTDGSEISVTRKVYSQSGDLLITDVFSSVYDPVTEVIKAGTGVDTNSLYSEKKAEIDQIHSKN